MKLWLPPEPRLVLVGVSSPVTEDGLRRDLATALMRAWVARAQTMSEDERRGIAAGWLPEPARDVQDEELLGVPVTPARFPSARFHGGNHPPTHSPSTLGATPHPLPVHPGSHPPARVDRGGRRRSATPGRRSMAVDHGLSRYPTGSTGLVR
jgi:hypothetical protein